MFLIRGLYRKVKPSAIEANILHFSVLGNHYIVLNSLEDAEELLEKRARIYSDRPVIPISKM